jgi:hypothetical protein
MKRVGFAKGQMGLIRTLQFALFSVGFKNGLLRFACGFATGLKDTALNSHVQTCRLRYRLRKEQT